MKGTVFPAELFFGTAGPGRIKPRSRLPKRECEEALLVEGKGPSREEKKERLESWITQSQAG
jgi:hypothetical protein